MSNETKMMVAEWIGIPELGESSVRLEGKFGMYIQCIYMCWISLSNWHV